MAKQSDDETDRASSWVPVELTGGRPRPVAIIGAIVGGTSLIMNFFYHPSPPPITIESGHSEFMKLSYADRIDRCVPHISEHLDAWRRPVANRSRPERRLAPKGAGALRGAWRRRRGGQGIVNTYLAVVNYAEKIAPTDEGENLLSCVYAPVLKMDPNNSYPDVESLVGSGNDAPKADNLVVRESPVYDQGEFAGVTAEGRPSKIVEVMIGRGRAKRAASWVSR